MKRAVSDAGYKWRGFDLTAWDDVIKWDLSDPCPMLDEKAGLVLLLEVIEHCVNPGLALKHISDITLSGGKLIITCPNPSWSGGRIHHLIRGTLSGFAEVDLVENHHVFTPWIHILEKLLNDVDFVIEDYVTLSGRTRLFRRYGSLPYPLRIFINALQLILEYRTPEARGTSYCIVARKK